MKFLLIQKIKELFGHKELVIALAIKDLKVRYKNAAIGFGWMLLNPLAMMIIFSLIFKIIFKIGIANYPVFLLSGLFPWTFFQVSLNTGVTSFVDNANLIKKTYFPREIIPISIVLSNLVNFLLSLVVLFIFVLIYRIQIGLAIIWLPLILLVQLMLVVGISLIASSLHTCYRDVRYILGLLLSVWFFATPIVYSLDMVRNVLPLNIFRLYTLNPMVGIVRAYHNLFLFDQGPDLGPLIITTLISIAVLISGFLTFSRHEGSIADIV